jgi:hypothetical protein
LDQDPGAQPAGAPPPPPGVPDTTGSGAAAPPPPPAVPDVPPSGTGWGAPVPPPTGGPGTWGAPDAGQAGWGAPSPDAQVGWDLPSSGSNGCLRACLIVGAIVAVLAIVAVVALVALGGRIVQQIQDNPSAFFGSDCQFVSSDELSASIDRQVQVFTLEGVADGTMGTLLDKRLLPDAPDCWIIGQDGTAGRIAVLDDGGTGAYAAQRTQADAFRLRDVPGVGDDAMCTTVDRSGSGGILVRYGERVVYVSMLNQALDSEAACELATEVAGTLQP